MLYRGSLSGHGGDAGSFDDRAEAEIELTQCARGQRRCCDNFPETLVSIYASDLFFTRPILARIREPVIKKLAAGRLRSLLSVEDS